MEETEALPAESIATIFCNVRDLRRYSEELVAALAPEVEAWSEERTRLAQVFLGQCEPMLRAFGAYMENHERALQELERQEKRRPARLEAVLEQLRAAQANTAWTLEMYLITPVQRLLRYTLLFRDYRAHTPDGGAEARAAEALLGALATCAAAVNANVRREQNALQLRRVRDSFASVPRDVADAILGDHLFVREGALTKVCRKTNMRRYFWLFSDCLVYGASAAQGYVFHRYLPLARMKVKSLADTDEVANAFQIITAEKSFTVLADTPCEKDFWLLDLTEALGQGRTHALAEEVYTGGQASTEADAGEAPVWVPDKLAARCMVCGASFSVIRRRHHCRNCGKVVCGACSAQKRVIPGLDLATPERVCKFCYDLLAIQQAERSASALGSDNSSSSPSSSGNTNVSGSSSSSSSSSTAGEECETVSRDDPSLPPVLRRQASMPAVIKLPMPPNLQQQQQQEKGSAAAAASKPRLVRTQSQLPQRPPPMPPAKPRRASVADAAPSTPTSAPAGSPKPAPARLLVQPPLRQTSAVSHVHSASAGATPVSSGRPSGTQQQQGSPRPLRRAPAPPEQQRRVAGDEVAALREKVARYEAELAELRARCAALEEENARLRQQSDGAATAAAAKTENTC